MKKKSCIAVFQMCIAGGLLLAAGCQSKVMDDRSYVPADENASAETQQDNTALKQTPVGEPQDASKETPEKTAPRKSADPYANLPKFEFTGHDNKGAATPSGKKASVYIVKKNDILSRIAANHGVSLKALLAANNMTMESAKKLRVGQKLNIPASDGKIVKSSGKSTKNATAKSTKSAKKNAKSSGAKKVAAPTAEGTYVIKSGDNIPKIARAHGVKSADLMKANNLDDAATRRLRVGQKLVIPGKGTIVTASNADTAKPNADKATDDALSAADSALDTVADKPAATAAPASAATPAATTVEPAKDNESLVGGSTPVEVKEATKLDEFVAKHKITAETFKKLNPDIVVKDGMIPAESLVFIPGV